MDLPHYTIMSRRVTVGQILSAQMRAELDAHTHAAWRSRDGRTFRLYGIKLPNGQVSYVIRQLEQDLQSIEPLSKDQLLAEYTSAVTPFRKASPALESQSAALLRLLDEAIPLAPATA